MKRNLFVVLIAILAFIGGLSVRWLLSAPAQQTTSTSPVLLPEFTLSDLSGRQHSIKEWQGKVLVINFWATWCPPCLKEMPEFEAMQKEYSQKGLQFIGVAIDDAEPVKDFIANKKITYPILLGQDSGTQLAHSLGNIVNTVPFTVIVDKKGQVVKTHMGELSRSALLEIVTPLL